MSKLVVGDRVRWNSEAGFCDGCDHEETHAGRGVHGACSALQQDPQYEIKSDKTDHVAMHKADVFTKVE